MSKGGHTTGTLQDEGELEQKEAGVQQEDTVLAEGATPGECLTGALVLWRRGPERKLCRRRQWR